MNKKVVEKYRDMKDYTKSLTEFLESLKNREGGAN